MIGLLLPLAGLAAVVALPLLIMRATGGLALKTNTRTGSKED